MSWSCGTHQHPQYNKLNKFTDLIQFDIANLGWGKLLVVCVDILCNNLSLLLQELKKHKVRDVVRVCEPTYKVEELREEGISVTDLAYDDGTSPPTQVNYHAVQVDHYWCLCSFSKRL